LHKQNFMLPTPSDGDAGVRLRPAVHDEEKGEFQLTVTELLHRSAAACGSWHSRKPGALTRDGLLDPRESAFAAVPRRIAVVTSPAAPRCATPGVIGRRCPSRS